MSEIEHTPQIEVPPQLEPLWKRVNREFGDRMLDELERQNLIYYEESVRARAPLSQKGLGSLRDVLVSSIGRALTVARFDPSKEIRTSTDRMASILLEMSSPPTVRIEGPMIEVNFTGGREAGYGLVAWVKAPLDGDEKQNRPLARVTRITIPQ